MINLLWASVAALALLAIVFLWTGEGHEGDWLFTVALVVVCSTWFVCGLITLVVLGSRSVGRTTCRNWSAQTGYRTKFEILNWADTGTCLALAPNGRWVLNTQVLSFANRKRP